MRIKDRVEGAAEDDNMLLCSHVDLVCCHNRLPMPHLVTSGLSRDFRPALSNEQNLRSPLKSASIPESARDPEGGADKASRPVALDCWRP